MASESDIRTLEAARIAAMLANDEAALAALLSERVAYSHSSGDRDTKAAYLERVRGQTLVYQQLECPIDQIILAGDAAVVVGAMRGTLL